MRSLILAAALVAATPATAKADQYHPIPKPMAVCWDHKHIDAITSLPVEIGAGVMRDLMRDRACLMLYEEQPVFILHRTTTSKLCVRSYQMQKCAWGIDPWASNGLPTPP